MKYQKLSIIIMAIVIIALVSLLIINQNRIKSFSQTQSLIPSGISQPETVFQKEVSPSSINAPSVSKKQMCLNEFHQSMEPLTGLREDSKMSDWKNECFERIINYQEMEFIDVIFSDALFLLDRLGLCYLEFPLRPPDNTSQHLAPTGDSLSNGNDTIKTFIQHLLCEVYRKGDKETYEKMILLGEKFLKAYFPFGYQVRFEALTIEERKTIVERKKTIVERKNAEALNELKSLLSEVYKTKKLPEGGCSENPGEEFLKTKEYFCKAIFSKYYLLKIKK